MESFKVLSIIVLFTLSNILCFEKARYDNYRVYEILIENDEQMELMKHIDNYPDGYKIMEFSDETGKSTQLIVPPHKFGEFHEFIEKFQLKNHLQIENLQEIFDNEQPKKKMSNVLDWTRYWNLAEVDSWTRGIAKKYPMDTKLINLGKSFEGRDILGIKLNFGNKPGKKQVIIEGTIHAREWISTATTTWMLNELITSKDPAVRQLAQYYEWIVFPVVNPDGYHYSWTTNRLWRKTRQPTSRICVGADPNRNFDNFFNQGGTSMNPCSDIYAGPFPFSEPETKQYSKYISNLPNLAAYFSIHSFGQMLMLPFGFTKDHLKNYDELHAIGVKAVEALRSRFGTHYRLGSIANLLNISTGSSLDWLKYTYNTNVTYAYELRDRGTFGFGLPASQIIDNNLEAFDSLITIMKEAQKKGIA